MPTPTPDDYESADKDDHITDFPNDTTSGKHYLVAVPAYATSTGTPPGAYYRLGVPHSSAAVYTWNNPPTTPATGAWNSTPSPTDTDKKLGNDLLWDLKPPDGFDSSAGGVREHSDGDRIITTRHDHLEVIGGQYRRHILNGQTPGTSTDPDWAAGEVGDDDETSVTEHIYPDKYYEIISTKPLLTAGSAGPPVVAASNPMVGEPRTKVADTTADFYEYINADNVYEVTVGKQSLVEKSFGTTAYGVFSGAHNDHAGWENHVDNDGSGDDLAFTIDNTSPTADDIKAHASARLHFNVAELILGKRVLEVTRASDYFEERLVCDNGDFLIVLGASRSSGTFTDKTWGYNIVMNEDATNDIDVTAKAGKDITEHVTAGGSITEITRASSDISENTRANGNITDVTSCDHAITELSASFAKFEFTFNGFDFDIAVHEIAVELKAAMLLLDVAMGIQIEAAFGPEKIEYHNGHKVEAGPTKAEVNAATNKIALNMSTCLYESAGIVMDHAELAAEYAIV